MHLRPSVGWDSLPGTLSKIELAKEAQERIKKKGLDPAETKIAAAGGYTPYLKQSVVEQIFEGIYNSFVEVGYGWKSHPAHGVLLNDFEDMGGLPSCPPAVRRRLVLWMVLCYLGEPGFKGWYGRNRPVFYSNSAAYRIEKYFNAPGTTIREDLEAAANDGRVKALKQDPHIAKRFERLLELTEDTRPQE
jgi:hypothetical protein